MSFGRQEYDLKGFARRVGASFLCTPVPRTQSRQTYLNTRTDPAHTYLRHPGGRRCNQDTDARLSARDTRGNGRLPSAQISRGYSSRDQHFRFSLNNSSFLYGLAVNLRGPTGRDGALQPSEYLSSRYYLYQVLFQYRLTFESIFRAACTSLNRTSLQSESIIFKLDYVTVLTVDSDFPFHFPANSAAATEESARQRF